MFAFLSLSDFLVSASSNILINLRKKKIANYVKNDRVMAIFVAPGEDMVKQQLTKVAETPVSFRLCHSWIMYQPCK
ncbi:hypothetical protein FisN_2Hu001 [Fistulifera solaris]|uniref:Uncharacterized protein n=1 Tax=Fistulifera solaris TaxID=1519565 RepID=A0A1Z5K9T2_FISSO|nr:hypothetical protein FisN_2Hu001 [Fistulifera solaris]|eukprot:GAX22956.1 hypothetical protein FisN_2Hu001 [Fistulifera solaris]